MSFSKISLLNVLLLCLLGTSCAWSKKWFKKSDKVDNAQLEQVGAKEDEVAKFAVQETPVAPAEPVAPPVVVPAKKKVVSKAPAPAKKMAPVAATVVATPGFAYPADYPETLRALDEKAAISWTLFRPRFKVDEKMFLDVDYLGMTVGKVVLSYRGLKSMSSRPVHHFQAFFKSAPFYSAIYELDDHLDTYVDQEKFVGLRSNLVQRESKQDIDEVQLYDRENLRTTAYRKQVRDGKTKHKNWKGFIPRYSIDPLSVLWLLRGLPLKPGDQYILPVVNKAETLAMEVAVDGREKIKTKLGEFASVRVKVHTVYTGKTLKSGDMTFWLSDDETRTLLRANAKIKIGSVYAEAVKGE
jgi:hypothetical protein